MHDLSLRHAREVAPCPRFVARCRPLAALALLLAVPHAIPAAETSSQSASDQRLGEAVRFLASDELEGRGVGTKGIDQAADFVAAMFAEAGLNTKVVEGGPFQKFEMTIGAEQGPVNQAAFVGPAGSAGAKPAHVDLKLGKDFNPMALGGSGKFNAPLVFVGYGITDKDHDYDDYAGLDVKNKAVIVMRHEPQQDNPHSVFNGTKHSFHAPYSRKLSNAYEHGAAAVIFCTDDYEIRDRVASRRKRWQQSIDELTEAETKFKKLEKPTLAETETQLKLVESLLKQIHEQGEKLQAEYDPLIGFTGAGPGSEGGQIPVLFCRREVINKLLKDAGAKDLTTLEKEIDKEPKPQSFALAGWRVAGETSVKRRQARVKNVLGVLPGEGSHADETVIVGAHYDHLGFGGEGSFFPDKHEIHNGADDNASGTSALIEVARRLAGREKKLARRVVFIAFTGEERGLIGSAYYCKHPVFPLDKTVAMLNMDMVGRLEGDKLVIQGVDTASEFGPLIDKLNEKFAFKITRQPGGFGPSDHSSFYSKKIPVMHFFTGVHKDYHRPSDDFDKINVPGMRRVAEMVAMAAADLADADSRPQYKQTKAPAMAGGGDRPYFGSIPDFSQSEPGYGLSGVAHGSPAEKGGLQAGDVIIRLGESRIGNLEDFDSALRKHKSGEKVHVVVKRAGKEVSLSVTLDPPR